MKINEENRIKLLTLSKVFNISITDISKVAGVSRPLVSRIVNEGLDGNGTWAVLERKLPELISKRRSAFFQVEAVDVGKVLEVTESLKSVA